MPSGPQTVTVPWFLALAAPIATFAAGYLAHVLVVSREAASRRRAFRGLLRSHLQKFEAIELSQLRLKEVLRLHEASVASIAEECAKILDDIPSRLQAKFNAACRRYCGLKREDLEPMDIIPPSCEPSTPVRNYERGRQRAIELLREIIQYAR